MYCRLHPARCAGKACAGSLVVPLTRSSSISAHLSNDALCCCPPLKYASTHLPRMLPLRTPLLAASATPATPRSAMTSQKASAPAATSASTRTTSPQLCSSTARRRASALTTCATSATGVCCAASATTCPTLHNSARCAALQSAVCGCPVAAVSKPQFKHHVWCCSTHAQQDIGLQNRVGQMCLAHLAFALVHHHNASTALLAMSPCRPSQAAATAPWPPRTAAAPSATTL